MKFLKTSAVLLLAVTAGLLSAAELKRWTFSSEQDVKKTGWYVTGKSQANRSFDPNMRSSKDSKGSMCVELIRQGNHESAVTPFFVASNDIVEGEEYSVSLKLRASKPCTARVITAMNSAPWKGFGKRDFQLKADQWTDCTLRFKASFSYPGSTRMPVLFLGKLPAGTKLWIDDVRFHGPKTDSIKGGRRGGNFKPIENFKKKISYSYADAWKIIDGTRAKVSLNQFWKFEPTEEFGKRGALHGYFIVPGHWRGGNITNCMRLPDGSQCGLWNGKDPKKFMHARYFRPFEVPASWKGRIIRLNMDRIEAGNGSVKVFVNGHEVPLNYSPLFDWSTYADISKIVKIGKENEIEVWNSTKGRAGGLIDRCGITHNVFLESAPAVNAGEPEIITSLDRKEIEVKFHRAGIKNAKVEIDITDAKTGESVYRNTFPFAATLKIPFVTPKLWSVEHPDLYYMNFKVTSGGKTLDSFRRRFGFREFKIVGWQYMLNNEPIQVKADTAIIGSGGAWCVDWKMNDAFVRQQIRALKKMNMNAAYFSMGAEPSNIDVADEEGFLLIMHHGYKHDWLLNKNYEQLEKAVTEDLEKEKEDVKYFNHPSEIAFLVDVWFNFHNGTMCPAYFGLKYSTGSYPGFNENGKIVNYKGKDPNLQNEKTVDRMERLNRVAKVFRKYFPQFETFTGGSGEVRNIYATHLYHTWGAPLEELRGFFSRWALKKELALFIGETNVPYPGSFYEITKFGAGGANPLFKENTARLEGNKAYCYKGVYGRRALHDHHPEGLQSNHRDSGSNSYLLFADQYIACLLHALNITIPGWRYNGLNGYGMFCYTIGQHFLLASVSPMNWRPDYSGNLSEPRQRSDRWQGGASTEFTDIRQEDGDFRFTEAAVPYAQMFAPVYCNFYEDSADALLMDHAYYANEIMRKKLVIMNDAPGKLPVKGRIILERRNGGIIMERNFEAELKPFERRAFKIAMKLPDMTEKTQLRIRADLKHNGKRLYNTMNIEVFPAAKTPVLRNQLYVFDPEGSLIPAMKKANYSFTELKNLEKLPEKGVLVIGRRGIKMSTTVPDFNAVASKGLGIFIMEQEATASQELMLRRCRTASINAEGHPVMKGLADEDFTRWRGAHALVKAYSRPQQGFGWSDNGNANMLASYVFRRPQFGNYRALLASGFDLFQTPLLEYAGTKNSWIGSQLEITERLGKDPVATLVFDRIISYLDNRGEFNSKTVFFGGKTGKEFIDKMMIDCREITDLSEKSLADAGILIVSDPDWNKLDKFRFEIAEFVFRGGKLYYIHTGEKFRSTAFPFTLEMGTAKARQALRVNDTPDLLWRCGWDNNDLYWHDEYTVPVFKNVQGQLDTVTPSVLVRRPYGSGDFVFCSIIPELFAKEQKVGKSPAMGKTCRMISALLASGGVRIKDGASAYRRKSGEIDIDIDLANFSWKFALDPQEVGLKEGWHEGKLGSGKWLQGLIADGIEVRVGMPFEDFIKQDYDGWVWYTLKLNLGEEEVNSSELYFSAKCIDDFDEVYINGKLIGKTGKETSQWWQTPRLYRIPKNLLKKGTNFIAVRVFDLHMKGGIVELPLKITNTPSDGGKAWRTPYPAGSHRDYDYKSDIIRQY